MIILKILDSVVLLLFNKFKNIYFSWNGSDLNFFFCAEFYKIFANFFQFCISGVLEVFNFFLQAFLYRFY